MSPEHLLRNIEELPPKAQQLVADLVAFLLSRANLGDEEMPVLLADIIAFLQQRALAEQLEHSRSRPRLPLEEEPFIGMWQDRTDMQDSTHWVRQLREQSRGQGSGL